MKNQSKRQPAFEMGKIPPQAIEIEEVVLGALLVEPDTLSKISNIISPKSFYKDANQKIAESIFELSANNKAIDLLTVVESLKSKNQLDEVGGAYQVSTLTSGVFYGTNIIDHAKIVQEKFLAREMIRVTSEFSRQAFENNIDIFQLISEAQVAFSKLSGFNRSNIKHISESLKALGQIIERNITHDRTLTGLPTGLTAYDDFSAGLQNGDLIIIAGEPSNGKTSLAMGIAANVAINNKKVALYSYEMSDRQLAARMIAGDAKISGKAIQYYRLNENQLNSANKSIGKYEQLPIFIDEMESSRYDYLERSIRSMVIREGIELAVVDYLQLIKSNNNRLDNHLAVAEIVNDLKRLAKVLNIPIILLSQLTRDKLNPKPTLARLKGSGDIENAADIVWFTWLPARYDMPDFDCNMQIYQSPGLAHHIIAKGRNIGTTEFVTQFIGEFTQFKDLGKYEFSEQTDSPY